MRITIKAGKLYELSKAEGISRDELARRMGVSTATAYRIDTGKTEPGTSFIAALMTLTKSPFEELFEIEGEDAA